MAHLVRTDPDRLRVGFRQRLRHTRAGRCIYGDRFAGHRHVRLDRVAGEPGLPALDRGLSGCSVAGTPVARADPIRSEEHTSELQSLMRISYAVFCLKKKKKS